MTRTDHLAKAKDYIAKGDDYYAKAADEIIAARRENPLLSWPEIAERLERGRTWCQTLVQERTTRLRGGDDSMDRPFAGGDKGDNAKARRVLRDPHQRRQVIASLRPEERSELFTALIREGASSLPPEPSDEWTDRAERADQRTQEKRAQEHARIASAPPTPRVELAGIEPARPVLEAGQLSP